MSLKLSHEQFLQRLLLNNPGYRDGLFKVISQYKSAKAKVSVVDKYGLCSMSPENLMTGAQPSFRAAINKKEYFYNQLTHKNPNFIRLGFEIIDEIKTVNEKISVIKEGFIYETYPVNLLKGFIPAAASSKNYKELQLTEIRKVHGNRYDYDDFCKKVTDKIKIYCKDHDKHFYQELAAHKSGQGRPYCSKYKNFGKAEFYILKCYDSDEIFLKIGHTTQGLAKRYARKKQLPYDYDIITTIKDDIVNIIELEEEIKSLFVNNRYTVTKPFGGSVTEVFNIDVLDEVEYYINNRYYNASEWGEYKKESDRRNCEYHGIDYEQQLYGK